MSLPQFGGGREHTGYRDECELQAGLDLFFARLDRLDVFRTRRAQVLERDPGDAGKRRIILPHDTGETLRVSARRKPLDLALDHEREHVFPLQRHRAQDDDGQGHDRADEQRPHE